MTQQTEIYARMLSVQAQMTFDQERIFYQNSNWTKANSVLDYGSGNSFYATKLYDQYEHKEIVCLETDKTMKEIACGQISMRAIRTISSPIELGNDKFDFFIFRLVLLHLSDRDEAYKTAQDYSLTNSSALVIDADDEYFFIDPPPKNFLELLSRLRSASKNRILLETCPKEFVQYGYQPFFSHRLIINSAGKQRKLEMYLYMRLTAQMANSGNIDPIVEEELLQWYFNPQSYAQYGIFGILFEKNKLNVGV